MSFQDHFSKQAAVYREARPFYPKELFQFLAAISFEKKLCWDCATGNGQAAIFLQKYFETVVATDASITQIENALPAANVQYRVASAEESGLETASVDLITVATAAHWFNHDAFYKEVLRVAKPNGVLALWTYSEAKIDDALDVLMLDFMYGFLHDYWPDGRWYVRNKYSTLPFPFQPLSTPDFFCKMHWTREQMLHYARSWSSTNRYIAQHNSDPLEHLRDKLFTLWADGEVKEVVFPLHLKVARLNVPG